MQPVCTQTWTQSVHVHGCVHACTYVCIYACVCVCVCEEREGEGLKGGGRQGGSGRKREKLHGR